MVEFSAQSVYNAREAGITSAIVIAVCLPIGICLWCFLIRLRQTGEERRERKFRWGRQNDNGGERKLSWKPNFGPNAPPSRSSSSSRKNKFDSDKDSGIQANEVKLHDDGQVTLERDNRKLYQDDNFQRKENDGTLKKHSTSSGDSGLQTLQRDDYKIENVNEPTFQEVVHQRSPIGKLPSNGSFSSKSPRASTRSTSKNGPPASSSPPVDSRSSSLQSTVKEPVRVPLTKQVGQRVITPDRYASREPMPPPPPPTTRPPDSSSDEDEGTSPVDSDAKYDGVYYTREPLNGGPHADFPTKALDVDIDVKSYKPYGNRPSAL